MKRFEKMMKGWSIWKKRISAALACIVVFVTVYAMVLPAITLDQNAADDDQGIIFDTEGTEDGDDRNLFDDSEDDELFTAESENGIEDLDHWSVELHWPLNLTENVDTSDSMEALVSEETEETGEAKVIDYSVTASFDDTAGIPADATLESEEIVKESDEYGKYQALALKAVSDAAPDNCRTEILYARFFDIAFLTDEGEIEPNGNVNIEIDYENENELRTEEGEELHVIHFNPQDPENPEFMSIESDETDSLAQSIAFKSDAFSVFGVVKTYTEKFKYEADGIMYEYSLPGGDFVSISDLAGKLGITEEAEEFVADVDKVEFSVQGPVWIGKTDVDTTVGQLIEENGLDYLYGEELTEEHAEKISSSVVKAGEWILISLRPFVTQEDLIVTLKDTEVFKIRITDGGVTARTISDSGEMYDVTVSFGEDAKIPVGARLKITEFEAGSDEYENARKAVLADSLARGESVNVNSLGLAALDITILDENDNEIEPSAPVQVDMTIKTLPDVDNLEDVTETLTVKHHVETEEGVVIETVYDGATEAQFRMNTAETVAEDGTAVNLELTDTGELEAELSENYEAERKTEQQMEGSFSQLVLFSDGRVEEDNASGETVRTVSFQSSVFSTFTVNWYTNRKTTIHYVDQDGNELTVSNGQPTGDMDEQYGYVPSGYEWVWGVTGYFNYLIYDVDGYDYVRTYRNSGNTTNQTITPILKYEDNRWKYTTSTSSDEQTWNNLSNDDHIYVEYKKKPDIPEGGTPVAAANGEKPQSPTVTKSSVRNLDEGTNTLALSVTSHANTLETQKLADVIVIYDISGSMNNSVAPSYEYQNKYYATRRESNFSLTYNGEVREDRGAGNNPRYYFYSDEIQPDNTRMAQAEAATKTLSQMLLGKNTNEHPDLIRMALIDFSNVAKVTQGLTTQKGIFDDAVEGLPDPTGGTNWEHALKLANEMSVDSERSTFIIFVTDGDPTFRLSRRVLENEDPGIGVSNGRHSDIRDFFYPYNVYGGGDNDDWGRNYDAALDIAQSIVEHGKHLYSIGISSDVSNLDKLMREAGAGEDHSKTAKDNESLLQAFQDIGNSILGYVGYSSFSISDGITDLSQIVQKSDLVRMNDNFASDSFTYYKGKVIPGRVATQEDVDAGMAQEVGGTVVESWNSWDPASENCNEAVYNPDTGAVEWFMGDNFMPEDGYTYQVRFKIWPSQEAYDLLADLNNGVLNYSTLEPEIQTQIKEPDANSNGQYTLKTNTDTGYSWREATKVGDTITPTSDPTEPVGFEDVDPLYLEPKPLKIKKQWDYNYVDSRLVPKEIELELFGVSPSGQLESDRSFRKIKLKEENGWYDENNFVSYGLVTLDKQHPDSPNTKIYETGHDFTLRELGENAHYYELSADIFRPMVINGTSTVLMRVDQPSEMEDSDFYYTNGRNEYYRLDGKVYMDVQSDVLLLATNTHRSFMDLTKVLDDMEVPDPAPEFQYEIKFTIPEEIRNNTSLYEEYEKYIWFSVYDPVQGRTLGTTEYNHSNLWTAARLGQEIGHPEFSGSEFSGYLIAFDGETFTLNIKPGWNVRFLNLPVGTTYEFKETNIPNEYEFRSAEVSGTVWNENTQSARQINGLPVNDGSDLSNTVISSTIEMANARYKTTYHNGPYTLRKSITVTKQWSDVQQNNHSGDTITFTLYQKATDENGNVIRDSAYTGPYDNTITGSGTVTIEDLPASGKIDGTPVTYTYYVEETAGVTGYDPVISHTEGSEGTPDAWTIENVKRGSNPRTTSVPVTKKWMENGQDVTGSHTLDEITVRLTQKILDTGYVPVTLTLKDADNTTNRTENFFIKKGQVTFTASRSQVGNNYPDNYGITLTVNGNSLGGQSGSSGNYQFEVTGPVSMTAALNGSKQVQTGSWLFPVTTTYYERWSNKNNSTSAEWSYTLTDTMATEDAVFAAVQNGSIGTELSSLEYTYTFSKDSLTGGLYPATAEGWIGTISDLPLFSQAPDGTYYYYTYTIDEIAVNGNPVNNGDTVGYTVSVDQTSGTITNTRKPPIDVTIRKVDWADLDNMSADTLRGAEFTLEKYTDSNYAIEDSTWTEQSDSDSNDDGIFTFTGLYEGYYQLVETAIPEGYVKTSEDPKFHVKEEEGQLKIYIIDIDGTEKLQGSIMKVENHTINVGNVPGASLPYTGGMGTRHFTILGSILIGGAGLLLWRRRRYI